MRTLSCAVLVAAALLGCAMPSSDTAGSPKLQTAVVAAGLALSTINRCLLQIEQARNTAVPECDAAEEMRAYDVAKGRVPANAIAALRPLDDDIERARMEVVGQLIRLVVPHAETPQAPHVAVATAVYPLVARSQWQAH